MKRWHQVVLTLVLTGAVTDVLVHPASDPFSTDDISAQPVEFAETVAFRPVAKQMIAREAADGRRSLFESAAMFRQLNRLLPTVDVSLLGPPDPRIHVPRQSDDEVLCWQVISYVLVALGGGSSNEVDAAVARLEAEFWKAHRAGNVIHLPDPTALTSARELIEQARASLTAAERQALFHPRRVVLER
jgi:hypothetical protein